jgi:RluA family pseudouridine synthase
LPEVRRKFTTSAPDAGTALAAYLADRLPAERELAEKLVLAGSVYVDRRREVDPERAIEARQRIVVYPPDEALREPPRIVVVHEDSDVVVIDKPPGMPAQAERSSAASAADRLVRARYPRARLFHRLDREASGLLLFTRREEARRRLQRFLDEGRLLRRYRAVVWGHVENDRGVLDRPIGPDPHDHRRQRAGTGREARTEYRVLRRHRSASGHACTLLELTLGTGRTHQIRVHLADAGHPICGDPLYNPASEPEPVVPMALAAVELCWPGHRVEAAGALRGPALEPAATP